jgi:hypothetical protein
MTIGNFGDEWKWDPNIYRQLNHNVLQTPFGLFFPANLSPSLSCRIGVVAGMV